MPEVHRSVSLDGRTIAVTLGSIVEEDVDAIVNAANSRLAHGGGVAAVIARAAGSELEEASRSRVRDRGEVPVGQAVVTTAGDLPQRGVIHAVGPQQGEGDEEEKLVSAVASALERADENDWSSVALPAISAGIYGVPFDICARAYVEGMRRHLQHHPDSSVDQIRLCLFDPDADLLEHVERAVEAL